MADPRSGADPVPAPVRVPRALTSASFLSSFDRFAITPMLVTIAADLHVPLGQAVLAASGYFLAYGCAQPLWGVLSDRYGRVRVMRGALAATAVLGGLSSAAPSIVVLIVLRALTGALFGAVVPTSLTYVGDTVPIATRQGALSDLQLALALGTALATLLAGGVALLDSWRLLFAGTAALAAVLAFTLRRLPEPPRHGPLRGAREQLGTVLRSRWAWLLYALGLLEGAVLLGCFTFFAPALQERGLSAGIAGGVAALYGVGTVVFSRVLKRMALHPTWLLMIGGGSTMCLGFVFASASPSLVGIGAAAILLGAGWSFLHSSLQTWATALEPAARGTAVALFAAAVFIGSAVGSALGAPLAEHAAYRELFALAALATVPLTVFGALGRRRYVPRPE